MLMLQTPGIFGPELDAPEPDGFGWKPVAFVDIQAARRNLKALLGTVTLKPRSGVLWAHPSPNAKSLVETRLFGRLHINSQILVAGA